MNLGDVSLQVECAVMPGHSWFGFPYLEVMT